MTRDLGARATMVALLLCAQLASAQGDDSSDAREAFQRGAEAAEEGRWADSLSNFQEAYLLSEVPTALFNAAMALRALGRHREARDTFQRILDEHPDTGAAERAQARVQEAAARVAVLHLVGLDPEAHYELRLDGRVVPTRRTSEVTLETDAGRRRVRASRDGFQPWLWQGSLNDGEQLTLRVEMTESEPERRSIARSPWLWIIVGVVVAGASTGLGLWLRDRAQLSPNFGNSLDV